MFKEYESQKLRDFYTVLGQRELAELVWEDAMLKSFHIRQELLEQIRDLKTQNNILKRSNQRDRNYIRKFLKND